MRTGFHPGTVSDLFPRDVLLSFINNAAREDLMAVAGIGEVLADKIMKGRPYKSESAVSARPESPVIHSRSGQSRFFETAGQLIVWFAALNGCCRGRGVLAELSLGVEDVHLSSSDHAVAMPREKEAA